MSVDLFVEMELSPLSGGAPAMAMSLTAPPGITIVFGPSGAGKSTLLSAISGIVRPDRGRIALGEDVWFDSEARLDKPVYERHVAFVFQSLALFPHMTVRANVDYGIERSISRGERARRVDGALALFRCAHVADRKPRTISGGEAQRVALARAFAMQPRAVLLDEPFSAMDRELRRALAGDVRRLADELRVPVLLVTHDAEEARELGDRAVTVEGGRTLRAGPVRDLIAAIGAVGKEETA